MSTETKKSTLATKVKGLLGVEDDVKLKPMIAYNSAIFFSGGGPYVLGCYLLPFLTKVEGLSTAQYGTVALFSCVCDAITDPLMGIITDRTRHKDGRHRPYLKWGVIPAMCEKFTSTDVLFYTAKKIASKELGLSKKDRIVITGGDTTGHSGNTNLIKIDEI